MLVLHPASCLAISPRQHTKAFQSLLAAHGAVDILSFTGEVQPTYKHVQLSELDPITGLVVSGVL